MQTAKNDALLSVALAYFDVQQARGILAGTLDSVAKARELARRVGALGRGLAPAIEVERVSTLLANLEQQAASARQDWRISSATLTRVLRLDPAAVVVPLEPPHLQVTLISPKETVDALIPVGLTNRPELAIAAGGRAGHPGPAAAGADAAAHPQPGAAVERRRPTGFWGPACSAPAPTA